MQAEYLVTGGCGFIGSNIVRSLTGAGHSVRVLDNLATGNLLNIRDLIDQGCVEFQHGDIRNPAAAHQACAGIRYVLHLAALPSVIGSVEDPALSHAVNLDGVVNMLVAARKAGAQRFVFSSSSAVYGDDPELPKRETMLPAPLSPYAVQKLSGEYYCRIFHGLYGLETFCLRYFNVFGPRQNPRSQYAAVVPLFIEAVREGRRPVVFGDGGQTRDFIFVGDIVQANLQCCRAPASAAGGIYNIAWGRRMTIKELAETVAKTMGHPELTARHEPTRPGEIRDSHADTTQAQSVLGWSPQVPFVEGLKRTVEWFSHGVG